MTDTVLVVAQPVVSTIVVQPRAGTTLLTGQPGLTGSQGIPGPAGAASTVPGPTGPQGTPTTVNGKSGTSITLAASDVGAVSTAAVGAANGVAPTDSNSRVPLTNLQVRTAQVTRAARPAIVTAGGTFSGFLASQGGPDATDGTWEAVYVEAFAPIGGVLYAALYTYLQAAPCSLSSSAATALLASIWASALSITP